MATPFGGGTALERQASSILSKNLDGMLSGEGDKVYEN